MRFWLTVIFGIFVVTGVSTAIYVWNPEMARVRDVEDLTVPLPDPQNSPKAVAVVTEETFKNVPQQKKGETVFKVVNEGVGRLDLKAGKPSCTCVGVELKKEKMGTEDSAARLYLEPGESAEFIVRWDTQERVGEFRVDAPLLTNDPFRKNVPFVVNLEVIPELQQRPEYVEFGTIPQGETPTRDAVFVTKLHEKFELSMDGEHKLFTTKIEPLPAEDLKTLEAKSGYRVVVTAKGPFPVGSFHDGLVLKTTLPKTPIA